MNPPDWLTRNFPQVAKLRGQGGATATPAHRAAAKAPRYTRERLKVDPRLSEVEGGRRAQGVAGWYEQATVDERRDMWLLMSEQFVADADKVRQAQVKFAAAVGTPDVNYRRATVSPRRRLLQRFSVFPEGIRFLVDLRAEMSPFLKADKRLQALDVEMEYMFSTWFDVGFLELRRISWDSPASLIEKLIRYEPPQPEHVFALMDEPLALAEASPVRRFMLRAAAQYLGREMSEGKPLDPVARFHLGNGARVAQLNWAVDPSPKELKQSDGLMVNYLYDLKRLDKHRALLAEGRIAVSGPIKSWL